MTDQLIPSEFLFRFTVPCYYRRRLWGNNGVQLGPKYRIPSFSELDGKELFADLRVAWNEQGLAFQLAVTGKSQSPWCRYARVEDSDGLHLFIDTRDTRTIHRASRYCHRFAFLPCGDGPGLKSPVARWLPINRAKEDPQAASRAAVRVRSEKRVHGYVLEALVPTAALTSFDPDEYPRLGFSYAVIDRELGWQTLSVGPEFPFMEDPSLWSTLELARASK